MNNQLRPDEEFVIHAVATSLSGDWWPGENPPDAYLRVGDKVSVVEISTLTQHVPDEKGGSKPRLSEDITAISVLNELSKELRGEIPDGRTVVLVLESPVLKANRLKRHLTERIRHHVSTSGDAKIEVEEEIYENHVKIVVESYDGLDPRKIHGVVVNRKSSPDILLNARCILEDRIAVKSNKCRSLQFKGALWLALFNDYWLAENDTYQVAMQKLDIEHPFEKILLVSGDKSVFTLYEKHNLLLHPTLASCARSGG